MERESRKRVKLDQRPKPKPLKSILNFTRDPPSLSSSARKRKAVRSPSPEPDPSYYKIRNIKKEKRIQGKIHYLIDWANHPRTGEVYPESWEPAENITVAAIREWESSKKQKLEGSKGEARHSENPSSSIKTDISEPIRTGKHKKLNRKEKKKLHKVARRAATSTKARFSTISQESLSSKNQRLEIKDSYEEDILPSAESVEPVYRAQVEIPPVPSTFNRAAYSPVDTSQPSQNEYSPNQTNSTQSQTQSQVFQRPFNPRKIFWEEDESGEEISEEPVVPASTSSSKPVFKRPTRPKKLFREKKVVIPDSQETGSSPFRASVTQADIGTGSLLATAHSSSGGVEVTLTSDTQFPGSSSFIPVSGPSDSITQFFPSESQPSLSFEFSSRGEETKSTPQVESVEQEQSLEEQGFQTQIPFSSQEQEDTEVENSELVVEESRASQTQQSVDKEIPEANESLDIESQQRQPSRLSGSISSIRSICKSSSKSSGLPPQLRSRSPSASRLFPTLSSAEDIPSLQLTCETASEPSSVPPQSISPPPVGPISLLAHNRQSSAPIQSNSPVQPSYDATTKLSSVSSNKSPSPGFRPASTNPSSQPLQKLGFERRGSSESRSEERKTASSGVVRSIERTPELSSSAMEDTSIFGDPTQDTRLLMKAARVKAAAKKAAERSAARSASTLPATPPAPAVPGQPLPLREMTIEKPAPVQISEPPPSPKASERESEEPEVDSDTAPKKLDIIHLEENEFIIPLPLIANIRDTYAQTMRNNKQSRLIFIENGNDVDAATDIDEMLDELEKICDHLDLIASDYSTQRKESRDIQARYAETVSTKCIFIAELIMEMRKAEKHLVILSRAGRMTEILEALLVRHEFSRTDGAANIYFDSRTDGNLQITVIELGSNLQDKLKWGAASLVVVFSSTSELNQLSALREQPGRAPAPLVSLVVTHSIEHLNLCIDKAITSNDRYLLLVDYLSQIQDEVGKLGPEYPSPPEAAKALATFIMDDDPFDQWPLPDMPVIEVNEAEMRVDPHLALQMDGIQRSGSTTQSHNTSSLEQGASLGGAKRQLTRDDSTGHDTPKRQRLSPLPTEPKDDSATHISATQDMSSTNNLLGATPILTSDSMGADEMAVLRKKVKNLESELQRSKAKEAKTRAYNDILEERVGSLERGINEIQPRYQEALNDRAHFETEMNNATARETTLRRKHDERFEQLKKLKEAKEIADVELITARAQLLGSSVPSVVEINQVKESLRTLQLENEKLKKRQIALNNDLDFTRNQYQTASYSAGEAVRNTRNLETQVGSLRAKASDNAVQIQEKARDSAVEQHLDRIRELKCTNDELVRELDRRTEEFRSSTNARRGGTRGASVPRSPRMGAGTMSPAGPQRSINRVIGANGSRGNSPAPGEFPSRGIFGEVGYASGSGAPGRWGNHLQ